MENLVNHNPEPHYISADNAISQELATTLCELVDERGVKSAWSYNPDCIEYQIANPFSKVQRNNDAKVVSILPELFSLGESCMRHMNREFTNTVCETLTGYHGFWILKYREGGGFDWHCDFDSGPNGIRPPISATACVLLNDEFQGGETIMGTYTGMVDRKKLGVLMWDGFTQHSVAPLTNGVRYALVMHYTGTIK
jgi:predicted 2-oxoglutarate/Fe(II)-dependent dioxygenase YbiX|tara:strand:+ start:570 stop:1157 length:588 start_codon:yes stop_codon:yes gene_type:complete